MRWQAESRRGISLLEVLFSIFVVAIGLLGLAALLPVGQFQLAQGTIADNSSALGQAGLRMVKTRRMLAPDRWRAIDLDSGQLSLINANEWNNFGSFAIDPLMIARNFGSQNIEFFPAGQGPGLRRVTLDELLLKRPDGSVEPLIPLVEQVFMSNDDIQINRESSTRGPDELVYQSGTWLNDGTDKNQLPVADRRRDFQGDYSWMVTVVREPEQTDGSGIFYERPATVSVVVFHQRPTDPARSERVASLQFLGAGWGGGDVLVTLNSTLSDADDPLRPGRWVMVFAVPDSTVPNRGYFRWYRIAAVDDAIDNPQERFVTLDGPDWPLDTIGDRAVVVLVGRVVGVYEEKMQFEHNSPWTAGFSTETGLRGH